MADSFWALADMVKINDKNLAPFEASNILNDAPVVRRMAAIPASKGTDHMVITETTEPTVGFRAVNDRPCFGHISVTSRSHLGHI